ncbi:MAG: hypothetical protein BWK74_08405, partial [Desulfobacteraceae bacterium A6]
AVCAEYGITPETLAGPGKGQPAATGRAVAALLVQEAEHLTLTMLSKVVERDITALSRAAERLRARIALNSVLAQRMEAVRLRLEQISECQA